MSEKGIRVLLIYPPSETQSHAVCPAGLLMLGAVLERAGYDLRLLDANARNRKRSADDVVKYAEDYKPHVICMTLLTPIVREAYLLAPRLKRTGAKLLAGGPHATIIPEEALDHGFDAAVMGEGELKILDAVDAILGYKPMGDVAGWVYPDGTGTYVITPESPVLADLDSLPLPARHLVNPDDYAPEENLALIFSSRGCPASCAYCAGSLFGKKFRFRSAQNVLDEMAHLIKVYGVTNFHFVDDAMTMDKERIVRICEGIRQLGVPVTWSVMTRIDAVDESLLRMLADAGCIQIHYGVESGSQETLKKIRKPHTVPMSKEIVRLTAEMGIEPYVFFILGFPWEDVDELEITKQLMVELSPYVSTFHPAVASILVPFPGTEMYEKYKHEYGFEGWWLGSARNYSVPKLKTHTFCETMLFSVGAVLDANFFYYPPEVQAKITEIFEFMFMHNLRNEKWSKRIVKTALFNASGTLSAISPQLEKTVFGLLSGLRKFAC